MICIHCKKQKEPDDFFRNYHRYKTCNKCAENQKQYNGRYVDKKEKEREERIVCQLRNMYRAVKSKSAYKMRDCAKEIYKFVKCRKTLPAGEPANLINRIAESWQCKDKKRMTESLYMLLDYIEKTPQT